MAAVARDAQDALLRLEHVAGATLDESAKLRGSFEKGQAAADRAALALIGATIVLVVLTGVLIYLTWILVKGEAG